MLVFYKNDDNRIVYLYGFDIERGACICTTDINQALHYNEIDRDKLKIYKALGFFPMWAE